MNAMKDALAKAGFDTQKWEAVQRAGVVDAARRKLMVDLGLKPRVEAIKQVRVTKGVVRTSGGLAVSEDRYEAKGRSAR